MGWLRLDASAFHDRAIRRTGSHGRRAFIAALMLSRERDWRKQDAPGWLPAAEFDALEVVQHWGERETPANLAAYQKAIEGLASPGGPFEWDEDGWWLAGWRKYQPDPTSLARKRKERADKWKSLKQAKNGHSDENEAGSCEGDSHVTGCHCDNRDVTLRDETRRTRVRDGTERTRTRGRIQTGRKEGRGGSVSASAGEPAAPDPPLRGSELREALMALYRDGCPNELRAALDAALKMREDNDPGFEQAGNLVLEQAGR